MAPKRKADAVESDDAEFAEETVKKPRKSRAKKTDAPQNVATSSKDADADATKPKTWKEVKLPGEDIEDGIQVYDNCNDIRRKIRQLLKEPGFKVTHWLAEIGNVNNNSYQRFMKATGPTGGAANGTYYCAYVYFEKRRILEGKKKTAARIRNEAEHAHGMPLQEAPRYVWVKS